MDIEEDSGNQAILINGALGLIFESTGSEGKHARIDGGTGPKCPWRHFRCCEQLL